MFILASTRLCDLSVAILPIAQSHAASCHACLDAVARKRKYLRLLQAPLRAQVEDFVAGNIAQGRVQLVALDGSTVVGWADILPGWPPTIAHVGRLGRGLLPAFRGHGLGTQRLATAIAAAREQGTARIESGVRTDNTAAISLYRQLGVVEEGYRRRAVKIDRIYLEELAMAWWTDD